MNNSLEKFEKEQNKLLAKSAGIAVGIYTAAFLLATFNPLAYFHFTKNVPSVDMAKFVEAEVYEKEKPHESHLTEKAAPAEKTVQAPEKAISKVADQGKVDNNAKPMEEKNVTQSGGGSATHGAVVIYSPSPKLPDYLKDRDLKASVLIEFTILADGTDIPKLVGPSGDDELDALAVTAVKVWKFSPAVAEYKPIDSKIRLRINFVVD